jgi:hypothetical protein
MIMLKILYMIGNVAMTAASVLSLGKKAGHFKKHYDRNNYQYYADPDKKRQARRKP